MTGALFLALLFVLTIAWALSLKVCSMQLEHRTTPLFVSGWSVIGLGIMAPYFGHLLPEGLEKMAAHPWLFGLCLVKGALLYGRYIKGQELNQVSLFSSVYTRPMSVGLIACVNYLLGEKLTGAQWFAAGGLCLLSVGFFFRGHLSDFTRKEKLTYADLIGYNVALAAIDFTVIVQTNWYALLLISNVAQLVIGLVMNRKTPEVLKSAFLSRSAIITGIIFATTEQVKFYQQVTINPIALVLTVQALTQPVILSLSALIWKERTVREQLVWGLAAFVLVMVPLWFGG